MNPTLSGLGMSAMNGMPVNPTDDWKAASFRQKIIQQIEDAVHMSPSPIPKNSSELENHVFSKANSREEYLALVAKLILHLRDLKNRHQQQQQQQQLQQQQLQQQQIGVGGSHPGALTQDPINALQSMTRQPQGGMMQRQVPARPDIGVPQQLAQQQRPAQYPPQSQNFQQPSTQQMYQTPVSPAMSSQQFSPAAMFVPPQSPQTLVTGFTPSPAASRAPMNAPSPSSNLNTPSGGNPPSVGLSPSPVMKPEPDQVYHDKLKQLQKYIDPLRRMINKINKDEDRKKDGTTLSKLQNLLDVLSDSTKKLPMAALLKCELALEKMDLFTRPTSSVTKPTEHHHMCQPLLDAVAQHSKSPMLNHTLNRTFAPALNALHGPPIRAPSPPAKRRKHEEDQHAVPNVIQGEIARLGQRFKVDLDPTFSAGKTLHLLCQLDDKYLPSVPPISIVVPENYPNNSPECSPLSNEYESSQFLMSVHQSLSSRLSRLSDKFSITALLNTWEMSVRQACRPPCENDIVRTH